MVKDFRKGFFMAISSINQKPFYQLKILTLSIISNCVQTHLSTHPKLIAKLHFNFLRLRRAYKLINRFSFEAGSSQMRTAKVKHFDTCRSSLLCTERSRVYAVLILEYSNSIQPIEPFAASLLCKFLSLRVPNRNHARAHHYPSPTQENLRRDRRRTST